MKLIDLHTHSTASDGTFTPSELAVKAAESNISVLALTDHDSVSGCSEAKEKCRELGIDFIPGVEISAAEHKKMHILGLGIDPEFSSLQNKLDMLKNERRICAERICSILTEHSYKISFDDVLKEAGNSSIGKPHIAKILLQNGEVDSIEEAFEKVFSIPKIRSLKKTKLWASEAISLIHEAGGLAVLAHPYQMKKTSDELHDVVKDLTKAGLDGIECWYAKHTPEMFDEYLGYAKEFGLYTSIGSDFHGTNKPGTELGTGISGSLLDLRKILDFDGKIITAVKNQK